MCPIILNSFVSAMPDHIIFVQKFTPKAHVLFLEKVVLFKLQIMQQPAETVCSSSWCYLFLEYHISENM